MNLLAKSLGQLAVLAVALFFFSCEDPTSLGYENPNPKFKVKYVDIPIGSSVVLLENTITDNKGIQDGVVLVGSYSDPVLGTVKAEPYLQFGRILQVKLKDTTAYSLDSVTVQFRLNFYTYGLTGTQELKFKIHEITADSLVRISKPATRYNNSSSIGYNPTPLGEATIRLDTDVIKKNLSLASDKQDTLLVSATLDKNFGDRLLNDAINNLYDTTEHYRRFFWEFKGLVLVPDASNQAIVGLNTFSRLSFIELHYRTTKSRGHSVLLGFNYPTFTNIQTDRSSSELSAAIANQNFDPPSGLRVVQNGSPVITKLDLSNFYSFVDHDSVGEIIINSAELLISNVDQPEQTPPHSSLLLQLMDEQNMFLDTADRKSVANYYAETDGLHYFVAPDIPTRDLTFAAASYNSTKKQTSTFITRFVQSLVRNRAGNGEANTTRITYLGLYPYSPTMQRSVHRTLLNKDDVKLRIYYTKPTNIDH